MKILSRSVLLFWGIATLFQTSAKGQSALQSPAEFLGYELGTRFTPHHRVMDYFEHVQEHSPHVELETYGITYEGRPLITAYIASEARIQTLDSIRQNNLRLAGMQDGERNPDQPGIVWLSYNVHGNESVSTEAALKTLHTLVDPQNEKSKAWLENTVIIIDPCLNPDGRNRYVNWYNQVVGRIPNARPEAREHIEPWPGGRTNHYYFDLNRDWAWMTQQEVQARVAHYNSWMPQIHVDFHEQGVNEPYYFAPAAEPYHALITTWQRTFQQDIGKNHASYFDNEGWLYFTRQVFDLLYPGYGDTWPTYNGAIGMTYEQGGSGRAGLEIITEESDTLSLKDRIEHHYITGLSTIEVTSQNKEAVLKEFIDFFEKTQNEPVGEFKTYVLKGLSEKNRLHVVENYLEAQGIEFSYATERQQAEGYRYADGSTTRFAAEPGDMIITTYQPKSVLLQVLFDPQPALSDSLSYDITSWSLPYVFGVDTYATKTRFESGTDQRPYAGYTAPDNLKPYAYLVEWRSFEDAKFLADLLVAGIRPRYAEKAFEINEQIFNSGTLIITRTGNDRVLDRFDALIRDLAQRHQIPITAVASGLVEKGSDFGSSDVHFIKPPRIATLSGTPLSVYSVGEIWHFFDQQLKYPITVLPVNNFSIETLASYDVLILPRGNYSTILPSDRLEALRSWIERGGRLISLESATDFLAGKKGFNLRKKPEKSFSDSLTHSVRRYENRQRESISSQVYGAIFSVRLDTSHPLAFGYDETYHLLKRSDDVYAFLSHENDWNVGTLRKDGHLSGFVGSKLADHLDDGLVIGIQDMGRGDVVYIADNPLFRGFWYNGKLLMANAVFLR